MSARIWYRTAAAFGVTAIACRVAGYVTAQNTGIEGAYFDRAIGAPAYAAVFETGGWPWWLPDILVGAAAAFAMSALVVAFVARRSAPRRID